MARKQAADTFVERSRAKHGDRFDYSTSQWIGFDKPIHVLCREHGPCITTPKSHLANPSGGCAKCREERLHRAMSLNTEQFLQRAREVHGYRYDYHLAQCDGTNVPVAIICPHHGPFRMKPCRHLSGRGCKKCAFHRIGRERRLPFWEFVERVMNIHGANRYEYELKDFVNLHSKISIACPKHGEFVQSVASHLRGTGCPRCIQSSGERRVRETLQVLDVEFIEQAKFPGCCDCRPLPFDFFVPDHKLLIEFDGRQHYDNSELWGGEQKLAETQFHDELKTRYAAKHGYRLVRIPYWEYDKIEDILLEELTNNIT